MKITFCFIAAIACLTRVSAQNCLTTDDNKHPNPNSTIGLYTGQQEFSLALLQAINQLNPESNLFFSPYSTYHALLLAYFISANQTENFLRKTLKLDPAQDKADVYNAYKFDKFATQIRSNKSSYEFTNANRMYVDTDVSVRECIPTRFQQELQMTDFHADPERARKNINHWVEEQTKDMIKDLLPSGSIDQSTNLVLVNAAYFKGVWENKFDPTLTKPDVFHISPSKRTFVDMMHVEGAFNHDISEDLMAHILELPYQGSDISMYILLPPFLKEDGVATVLKRLTLERFRSIVDENNTLMPKTVQVSIPKFSLEHTIEMVPKCISILNSEMMSIKLLSKKNSLAAFEKYNNLNKIPNASAGAFQQINHLHTTTSLQNDTRYSFIDNIKSSSWEEFGTHYQPPLVTPTRYNERRKSDFAYPVAMQVAKSYFPMINDFQMKPYSLQTVTSPILQLPKDRIEEGENIKIVVSKESIKPNFDINHDFITTWFRNQKKLEMRERPSYSYNLASLTRKPIYKSRETEKIDYLKRIKSRNTQWKNYFKPKYVFNTGVTYYEEQEEPRKKIRRTIDIPTREFSKKVQSTIRSKLKTTDKRQVMFQNIQSDLNSFRNRRHYSTNTRDRFNDEIKQFQKKYNSIYLEDDRHQKEAATATERSARDYTPTIIDPFLTKEYKDMNFRYSKNVYEMPKVAKMDTNPQNHLIHHAEEDYATQSRRKYDSIPVGLKILRKQSTRHVGVSPIEHRPEKLIDDQNMTLKHQKVTPKKNLDSERFIMNTKRRIRELEAKLGVIEDGREAPKKVLKNEFLIDESLYGDDSNRYFEEIKKWLNSDELRRELLDYTNKKIGQIRSDIEKLENKLERVGDGMGNLSQVAK